MTGRRSLLAIIAISTACRLAFAASVGLGNDEAYHALFALRLDWSYFDHPPMMALVARLGLLLAGGRITPLAMRLGFIAMAAGSTWLMARLTSRFFGDRAGLIAAVVLNATPYDGLAAGTFVLPDGPLLFFWLLTLDRLAAAVSLPGRVGPWLGVGLAWGGAMLSKYHAIFLPMGVAIFLIVEPTARRLLRSPGPYLAFLVGMLAFSPVIAWNASHGWASFAFQGERAGGGGELRPMGPALVVLGQAAYLTPWVWGFLVASLVRGSRRATREDGFAERFLIAQTILPLAMFLLVALGRDVLPHWSLAGLLPAFPLLGRDWAALSPATARRRLILLPALLVAFAALFVAQARWGIFQKGGHGTLGLLDPANDPTVDLMGWDVVAEELSRRGLLNSPGTFLFTSKWYDSGHLAFATGGRWPVLCYSPRGGHNFAYWEDGRRWDGHDGLLVAVGDASTEPGMFDPWFERIEPAGEITVLRAGSAVRRVRLFRCVRQIRPFPEQEDSPRTRPARSLLPRG